MEVYYEKNITSKLMDEHAGRFRMFDVIKKVSLILLILAAFFTLLFHDIPLTGGVIAVLITALSVIGFLLPFAAVFAIFTVYLAKKAVEFDYYLLGSTFRIVKVVNRKKRKLLIEVPVSSISSIGRVDSDGYARLAADKTVKQVKAYCNDGEDMIYAFLPHDGERKLVLMEADSEYIANLRKAVSLSILDESLRKIVKTERAE